jgi:hypothetical protein
MSADDLDGDAITVHVPTEPLVLTRPVCRILLAILVELTEVEVLDGPRGRGSSDC